MADKNKGGRASAYVEKIAPNLDTIKAMARMGISQKKMREMLAVSKSTWEKYKAQEPDFAAVLKVEKLPPKIDHTKDVEECEKTMMMLANGYTRTQTRFINTKDGLEEIEEEVYYPPNFQALRFLLMNWGGYMSEPAAQAQRKEEFEHKKAMDEKEHW